MTDAPQIWLAPDMLFDGQHLRQDAALAVQGARSGKIAAQDRLPHGAQVMPMAGTLCAGFVDMQVNGGGLSQAPGLTGDLARGLRCALFAGFAPPPLRLAEGGDTSGARGAAYAAFLAAGGAND